MTYNPEFQRNPASEVLSGFSNSFRTGNHLKSKGIDFQIQYPKSWQAKEGQRPNVIQLITSENGRGLDNIVLMVRELPLPTNYKATERELNELFSHSGMKKMLPNEALFISSQPIVMDQACD